MSSNLDLKALFDLVQSSWHKPISIILSIVAASLIEIPLLRSVEASSTTSATVYLITFPAIIIGWFYTNRLPKTPKGKVGFVVCIQCSNEEENKKIREDFITTLRLLLKHGVLGNSFNFIEMPQHIAESINGKDDAVTLKAKTKAHFIIYGRVRLRPINGKDCHIMDLEGIVTTHKPIPQDVSNLISTEFGELFPRRVRIPTENDLFTFQLTSDWTECVAKYIIGIASACSHDLNYAESLFLDIQKKLEKSKTDFPVFEKLKQRLPSRLAEIYVARAYGLIDKWRRTNDQETLDQFNNCINNIPEDSSNFFNVLILRSVEAFLNGRNINKAKQVIKSCKKYKHPVWHFNLAFLSAYEGNLKKAIQQYRICCKYEVTAQTKSEVEDFIVWILEEEPDKYQFYYCLGFFNWQIKGDLKLALYDFNEFLNLATDSQFIEEKKLATEWCSEIKKLIN